MPTVTRAAPGRVRRALPRRSAPSLARLEALVAQLRRLAVESPVEWRMPDLTLTQMRALFALRTDGPVTIGALADRLDLSLASASALVDRLERAKLVRRSQDPADRRRVDVSLSASGAGLLDRGETGARSRLRESLQLMTARERAALQVALQAILRVRRLRADRSR